MHTMNRRTDCLPLGRKSPCRLKRRAGELKPLVDSVFHLLIERPTPRLCSGIPNVRTAPIASDSATCAPQDPARRYGDPRKRSTERADPSADHRASCGASPSARNTRTAPRQCNDEFLSGDNSRVVVAKVTVNLIGVEGDRCDQSQTARRPSQGSSHSTQCLLFVQRQGSRDSDSFNRTIRPVPCQPRSHSCLVNLVRLRKVRCSPSSGDRCSL